MNTITIKKAVRPFDQAIQVPGDKSISHRAVMLASLAKGRSRISGFLPGEDNLSTIEAFRAMGITIDGPGADGVVTVNGLGLDGLKEPSGDIDCGNSGTTVRLLSGILAGQDFAVTLKGDSSLSSRPMKRVTKPLEEMGARFTFLGEEGKLPYTISGGKLKGIDYKSPVASAQIKSSVLLAGLFAEGETTVTEPLKSRDHTERMLILFGVDVSVDGVSVGVRGGAELQATEVEVPGDISSAAFFMVAAALKKDSLLTIKDVGINPTRIGIIDILKKMGADVTFNDQRGASEPVADIVIKGGALKGVDISGEELLPAIDEFPIICVAAALAEGKTTISGAAELRVKESDRIKVMAHNLTSIGVKVFEREDGIIIEGSPEGLKGGEVATHGDHRIAMSFAVAGLFSDEGVTIKGAECVDVSFPGFFTLLDSVRDS